MVLEQLEDMENHSVDGDTFMVTRPLKQVRWNEIIFRIKSYIIVNTG